MNLNTIPLPTTARPINYLTLRSISSLNNPQNSEMKFCENVIEKSS
jgi:hypothetical protein